jgi:hypothetical protein
VWKGAVPSDDPMFDQLLIAYEPGPTPPRSAFSELDELDRQIMREAAQGIDPDPMSLSPRRPAPENTPSKDLLTSFLRPRRTQRSSPAMCSRKKSYAHVCE